MKALISQYRNPTAMLTKHDTEDIVKYGNALAEDGVVKVEDFLSADDCDDLRMKILERIEEDVFREMDPDMSYGDMAGADEPIIVRRGGKWDTGMVDVFNIDYEIPELEEIKNDPFISGVINEATAVEIAPSNINAYYNQSVSDTRAYHADSYANQFKSFVYLTDVLDESYGPFSYVPGSHDVSEVTKFATKLINRVRGRPPTDAIFFDNGDVEKFTAPKGTLIISNQQGYHRGIPQARGKERLLVTTSYGPA